MAKRKQGGSTKNAGKNQNPKYLGVKLFGGQITKPGAIIVRQRGTRFLPGKNVVVGRDHTLQAKIAGFVQFKGRVINVKESHLAS